MRFEWESAPRSRAPELNATWARLEIRILESVVTRVEDRRCSSTRTGIYVPLFPIAEWLVSNWFFLWDEWREDAPRERHNLLSAREGFALPDLSFRPTESKVHLAWRRSEAPFSRLEFLAEGTAALTKAVVREECCRLVEAVIQRLRDAPGEQTTGGFHLDQDWQALKDVLRDREQRQFCERAARLGLDGFDVSEELAEQIEALSSLLPDTVLDDFCNAVAPGEILSGAGFVRDFLKSSDREAGEDRWEEVRGQMARVSSGSPWRDGYEQAARLRSCLGLEGRVPSDLAEYLRSSLGHADVVSITAPSRIEGISRRKKGYVPKFGIPSVLRPDSQRFVLARAVGDFLALGETALITKGHTEHQRRNRAFAAEFLAPADSIRKHIHGETIEEDDLAELAAEFQVSDYVIRHQIENHGLARIAA